MNSYIKKEELNKWTAKYFKKDLISIEDLLACIEDLDTEIDHLNEKIEDILEDRDENWKRKDIASQIMEA